MRDRPDVADAPTARGVRCGAKAPGKDALEDAPEDARTPASNANQADKRGVEERSVRWRLWLALGGPRTLSTEQI
jgi:hypothetical protein